MTMYRVSGDMRIEVTLVVEADSEAAAEAKFHEVTADVNIPDESLLEIEGIEYFGIGSLTADYIDEL